MEVTVIIYIPKTMEHKSMREVSIHNCITRIRTSERNIYISVSSHKALHGF